MKLFLDTANLKEIELAASWGVLDGVTTNPTLISKEHGVELESHLKAICELVEGPVSMEVISLDSEGMVEEGRKYSNWASNIVVKVPMTPEGLKAVRQLSEENIPTNVTLVFSANQALLAAKAGATYVSPFIGRLDDNGQDGMQVIEEIVQIFDNYSHETQVLVASVRHPRHITEAAMIGADIATLPYSIFEKLVKHPMTDLGLQAFLNDWNHRS
jgi:transaldolase